MREMTWEQLAESYKQHISLGQSAEEWALVAYRMGVDDAAIDTILNTTDLGEDDENTAQD